MAVGNVTHLCSDYPVCNHLIPVTSLKQLEFPAGALGDFFGPGTTVGIPLAAQFGIRMALGARPVQVTGPILAETAAPVGAGVAIGVVGAFGLTGLVEKMLYGVAPTDPVTFAGASTILILLGILAAYVPSRRAARLNPVETLRCE